MSGNGRAGNGRGNNRRRPFRRRDKNNDTWQEGDASQRSGGSGPPTEVRQSPDRRSAGSPLDNQGRQNRGGAKRNSESSRTERVPFVERPKWIPPKMNTEPLPVPDCPWCGKPIRDLSQAIADKDSGVPVHFDCVAARIAGGEKLEKGDTVTYIGGGRFGIVCFGERGSPIDAQSENTRAGGRPSPSAGNDFRIKKIIEWENKDKRAEWRSVICDHYSVT